MPQPVQLKSGNEPYESLTEDVYVPARPRLGEEENREDQLSNGVSSTALTREVVGRYPEMRQKLLETAASAWVINDDAGVNDLEFMRNHQVQCQRRKLEY